MPEMTMNHKLLGSATMLPQACDLPGEIGDRVRASMATHARADVLRSLNLSHAQVREARIGMVRASLRSGALLNAASPLDLDYLLKASGLSDISAGSYMAMALLHPSLAEVCTRRRGSINEAQAIRVLSEETVSVLL